MIDRTPEVWHAYLSSQANYPMNATFLATRVFATADQEAFATLSGDCNPIHMDATAARRTQAGACVVHGVHLLLWTLEELTKNRLPIARLVQAKIKFVGFVSLDSPIQIHILKSDGAGLRLHLTAESTPVLTASLSFGERSPAKPPNTRAIPNVLELRTTPNDIAFEVMEQKAGRLNLPDRSREMAKRLFPMLCDLIDCDVVCEMALLSALVGMVIPGLHSIFSELELYFRAPDGLPAGLTFHAKRADPRFRKVELSVAGSRIAAEVTAFARLPPSVTPPMESFLATVAPGEFQRRHSLVIGGSRGIGAVTAKTLAAGGGSVVLSYADGRTEAEAVHGDIIRICGPRASTLIQYRAGLDPGPQLADIEGAITHVYYFSTPRIFGQNKGIYRREKLAKFLQIYVDGFYDLAIALFANHSPKALTMFYPSSTAITDRPKGMTEYAMAKAAGEVLCTDLMRLFPGLAISMPRLPRIHTDQTATVPPVPAADALDIMLPLIRLERDADY